MRDRPIEMPPPGYVYFVQAATLGLIKIGYATNLDGRISAIRSQSPDRIVFLGWIEAPLAKSLEAELHLRFARHHAHGEWFKPAKPILSYIVRKAKPPVDAHWADVELCGLYGQVRMLEHAHEMAAPYQRLHLIANRGGE